MKYRAVFLILFAIVFCETTGYSQVEITKNLQFDSASVSSSRTIQGIVLASDSTSGIPHSAFLETRLNYVSDQTGSATLNINLNCPMSAYTDGFELVIKAASANPGALFLNVNGLGAVEVKKRDTESLISNEISTGQVFKVIHNGTYFILQSPSVLKYPPGFVNANDNFCIETMERPAALYLPAVNACYAINARLCTWGEWYYACQKTSLGLVNTVNNYEYVDDTGDHANTVIIVGNGSCTAHLTNLITNTGTFTFRCCYNK